MNAAPLVISRGETIDEVIQSLDRIIEWSKENKRRFGYFAALYRKVTVRVKEGIKNGLFEDGERMARLDVIFANRYLDAFEKYQTSEALTQSWKFAFDTAERWRPIVLQHLLIGMNTHIDLDLGIAAAQTVEGAELSDLKNDFFKINDILVSLVNDVQAELAHIWPLLKILDFLAVRSDEAFAKLGMKLARGHAWKIAEELSGLSPAHQSKKIEVLDQKVTKIGKNILSPGYGIPHTTRQNFYGTLI